MMPTLGGEDKRWGPRLVSLLSQPQHRNTWYLTLNTVVGAGTGVLFWLALARLFGLPASQIGIGYSIIALGTIVGVVAKGGLDTALVRNVPQAGRVDAHRLLRFALVLGTTVALALSLALAWGAHVVGALPALDPLGWTLVAAIGGLLVTTWLMDAYFVAERHAKATFQRNLVFSGGRLLLPLPLLLLAFPGPVALTWALALLLSAVAAAVLLRGLPHREGPDVPRRLFMRSATRNITGSAAEFLPGWLLAPIVLAVSGADAAAYFGIAWTGASMLYLVSAAVSRSALAEMVRGDASTSRAAIRRGIRQLLWLVAPGVVVGILLAPHLLGIFGPDYAREGAAVFVVLAASTLFIAPAYLYLGVLRAHERPVALVVFPTAMVVAMVAFAPIMGLRFGLLGVGYAWLIANAPFGLWAMWRLRREMQEPAPRGAPQSHHPVPQPE